MIGDLKGRSLFSLKDYSAEDIRLLLNLAHKVKHEKHNGEVHSRFLGKSLAILFEKTSTRTRASFETAFGEEGGHPVFLGKNDIQLGGKETLEDTARVLGRMFDAIAFRGFKDSTVQTLIKYAGVPVYNGLTDTYHPTQILADLLTLEEVSGQLQGHKMVYLGDGRNNMANSLMIGCAKMGVNFTIAAPKELQPDPGLVEYCQKEAEEAFVKLVITDDPLEAVKGADALYTDVWASMGEEASKQERIKLLRPYQVNSELLKNTGKDSTIFLHCLPAERDYEVTADVIDGAQSRVWDQAENRKHTIKALMLATL
ncbi:ornithine carbamoyltransferase [Spirochaeta cellobiosiphila]|uniref:ornithine carbamoyltransferase n=1 Tax=Spirochaeta cellobiosiphila TaxID=504483 RepID=UPI000403FBF0|nr:ornithine carbamoyltransferase [Spirochaeta cellobiosiphila]